MSETKPSEVLVDPASLAAELGIPRKTLFAEWRSRGTGPRFYRIGRHVRYRRSGVDAWLAAQERGQATRSAGPA